MIPKARDLIFERSCVSRDSQIRRANEKATPCLQKNEDLQRKKLLSRLNFDLGGRSGP